VRRLQVLALLSIDVGVEHQLRHPDHSVHGRPDLVAHVGQEGRLGSRGLERLVAGGGELELALAALGHVTADEQ
jgi:hypothetical protein